MRNLKWKKEELTLLSQMDLLENKCAKETHIFHRVIPAVRNWKFNFAGKKVCLGLSIITITIVWIIMLIPFVIFGVRINTTNRTTISTVTNTIFNLLPPINVTSNYSNFTIERVECVDNFVYVPGDEMCYPECDWNPSGDDSVKIVRLILNILSVFSIALCTATLIAWLLLSCIDWKKFRFHYDFQLPRTSLFMVVLSSLFLVVLSSSIDLTSRDFYCQSTKEEQSYLLAHMIYSVSNVPNVQLTTHIVGSLYYYSFLITVSWIVFSMINIIFIVFVPQFSKSYRRRILVFSIQCLICFVFNLIPVAIVIALNPDSPYVVVDLTSFFTTLNMWGFLSLFILPYFLVPALLITLAIVVVTKLRFTSLTSKKITGQTIKLTDLEKRLIIYGIVLTTLILFQGIDFILLILLSPEYFEFVTKFILCINVNSPILTLPSNLTGSNATLNDTVRVYRENPYGDVDACRMFESEANSLFPNFITLSFTVLYHLTWFPIFFVLMPHITPKLLTKWCTKLHGKYTSS